MFIVFINLILFQTIDNFVADARVKNISIISQQVFLYNPLAQIQNLKVHINIV